MASFLPILAMERAPKKVPRRLGFFTVIVIPGLATTMLLFFFFFATFLENLLSLKRIHSYWLSERIMPHLSYIASVIMSVVILQ